MPPARSPRAVLAIIAIRPRALNTDLTAALVGCAPTQYRYERPDRDTGCPAR